MSTPSRQYYKEVMQFVTSKEFKSLPQQAQNKIKQVAKETHSKLREAEDARQPVDERETRKARGVLTNALTDLYSGMASVGKSGASLAAWTADIAGAKDTAKTLDEAALSLGNVAERITPAADPESWVDFGAQSVAQNAPMLASAIIGGKALAGSKVLGGLVGAGRTALGVPGLPAAASGLSPSAASFASTLGVYGIPGARQANVEADYELTGKLREGKPFAEVMMAVPYAWVENTMGIGASKFMGNAAATNTITSMLQKNASKVSKALSKPLFELSNKSGVRGAVGAFARWIADNVVGEAGEEVIQGIMEEAMPFFTDLPVEQAIAKSLERINSPEVAEKLALQAKGGGIVGAVLGGGRTAVQSAVTAREAKLAERADAAAKIVADKAYSIMHESKDYASMITGLKKLHAQTEDQSHKDRIAALIAMAHRKFSQQAQAELVMPPQEVQPNPVVESVVSGAGDVIAGQRDRLTGLSARLDNALANKYSPQEDSGVSPEIAPAVEQTSQGELLPEGKTVKDERLKLWTLKARTQSAIRKLQAINPNAPKAQTMDDAKEIDYNRASAIFEYALNPADEQSGREAIEAFREYPIELQEMIKSDYEQAQPEAGKRLSVIPGTWKAKKEAAKQAELEAKQAKTAAKKARLAEQKRIANERAKAEATYPVESARLQPNAAGVQIVDKSGRVPSTKRLVAAGDASRIEKKLLKPADVTLPAEGKTEAKFDASKEPSYNRTLKNIEILRKEGVRPYIRITRRIDNRNVVYEAYTPEGKLLTSSKKHSGSGSVEDKLSKRKDRYFSASIGSVEINKDDVFSMALFQQKQQEIDRQIQTYNGEADAMALGQPTVKQPEPAAEQKPAESVKQPAIKEPRPVETIQKEIASVEAAKKKVDEQQATPPSVKRERIAKLNKKLDPLYSELERAKADRLKTVETDRKSSESYKNATILRQSDIGDGYSFMAKIGDKYVMVSKNRDYYLIGNARNATKFVSRIEAESAVDTWNENQEWKAKQEQTAPKPALEVFKGDDITFQFPDGRTEGAYVQDATPKTIDGIADQIYVKLDANGALRYLPKSWITKVKPSLMRQNKMDLAATEAKREADTAKPEAWHTKLPETGKKTTGSTAEIINATSDDAFSALTADQKRAIMVGQDKFNLYVLPATNGNAGVIRFIPEDQKPANGWVQIPEFKETYRLGKMTEAQQKDLLTRAAWRAPILPAEQTRSSTAEKTKPEKTPAPKPAGKIEDFGEVLHGARKLYSQEFADSFKSSGDLATQPLSKSWPEPDYQKLIDAGMNAADVSLLRSLRDTLPAKPRNAWRVKSWLEIAKKHKTLAEKIVSGKMESKDFHQDGPLSEFLEIKNLMSLYEAAGHSASLAGAKIRYGTYFYQNGVKLDTPVDGYEVLMPGKNSWGGIGVGFGKTMTEAIADFKKKLPAFLAQKGATAKQRTTQFSVYQKMRGEGVGTYFIAYKTGGKLVELKKGFATGKEAQDYRNANRAELEAILKGKRDVKPERRATNQPRVGKTRRTGDVTPQQFTDTFGFRGVQFGNWVEGDRRQVDLNEAYDALSDLADVLGIPARALSLNGELGLAFGSRGKGGKNPAAAHYEPGMVVINLTKKKGAGSLAHEWWHALDNYFGKGTVRGMATESAAEYHDSRLIRGREEIKNAFWNLGKTIKNFTDMKKRGKLRDETRSKPYWSTDVEISARSFESFILSKLSDAQINNDYLANIVSEESYTASAEENDYPYLLKSEIPSVKDAFNALFQTMQSEKTDKGIKLYSVEHLVAKYAARGLKQSAKIVRAGWDLFKSGVTKFADWAKGMLKQFGSKIGKQLRSMYADLQAFNKQLGKEGMIKMGSLGRPGFQKMAVVAGRSLGMEQLRYDTGHVFFDDTDMGPTVPYPMNLEPDFSNPEMSDAAKRRSARNNRQMNARFKAQQEKAIAEARAKDPAWREFLGMNEKTYKDNEAAQLVAEWQAENGNAIFSVEYLIAKYGYKYAKAGYKLLRDGVNTFVAWAKPMLKEFGSKIGKQLRSLYADLQTFNKQLGRAGAVGSRGLKGKFKAPVVPAPVKVKAQKPAGVPKSFGIQSKDLKWTKDNSNRLRLVNDGKAVATLERNEKKQWLWKGTNRAFLNLGRAKSVVKQELFKVLKEGERQTARYKKAEMKANEQAEARKRKHDDYFSRPLKDNFDGPETKLTLAEKWQNFLHKVDETLFDRWAREKRLIAGAVSKKGLARIPESENFYQRHELLANRIAARTEDFKESQYQPIENYLVENNISYKAFNRFLRVMHAEERNNHVFQINPEFRQRAMEDPDNPMYAGSGITTKAAREEIARMKADGTFETFNKAGKMFWDLNNKLLDIQVKYGILPADVRDVLKNKYKYYAPLKSMDEDSKYLDWRALGRRSESSDQLAHTVKAIESTFSYGENTWLRRAFAKFAINNPNPALYEIRRAIKKPYFDEDSGEVKYRLDMEGDRENILYVKNGGNDLVFIIKDPDLLASLTNKNAAEVGGIGRGLLFVNRWLGAVNTAFAPEFMIANLIRDVQTAGISLSAEQSSDMAAKVLLNIPKAITAVAQYKMGERNADGALYKEFLMQGGKIGYRDVYNLQETAKDLEKKIAEAQKGGAWFQSKTLLKDLGSFISDCNDVIESGTRLSTYMEARKAGMSKQAAAALAAGVTINFQKKGTWGQAINALYLFGSASLGGTARTASAISKASQTKTGRAIIAGTVAYGFVADIINRILGGIDPDDERSYYDKINAAEKDMNYILMIPGTKGKHLKLPMPHGFSALPAMGRNLSAMMFGDQTLLQSVGNVANTLVSSFSPTGYDERGLGHTVMPTALGLPVDFMSNSKFTGNRIKPEQNPFGAKLPQSQLVNKNTNKLLVALTQALNSIAGGDERTPSGVWGTDISAADLQHVIESLTGGAGKMVSRSVDLLWRVGAAEEIPVGNIPFVRRLIGEAGDYSVYDSFIDRRDRVKRFEDARRKEDAAWVSDNRWLEVALRRYRAAEKTAKDIRNDSTLSDSDKRERVVLEQKRFNRDFDKIKAQYDKPGATIPVEPETKKNSRPGRPRPPKRPKRPRLPKLSRL